MTSDCNQSLVDAAWYCDPKGVESALLLGADPNYVPPSGWPPLLGVALKCRWGIDAIKSAKLLVSAGADLTYTNSLGQTALSLAVETGCFQLVQFLLEQGADVRVKANADNPLEKTSRKEFVELLLRYGADPFEVGMSGHSAFEECQADISELLSLVPLDEHETQRLEELREIVRMMMNWLSYRSMP